MTCGWPKGMERAARRAPRGLNLSPSKRLVDRARLDQLEDPDFGWELGPVGSLHVEGSCHRAKGSRQGTSGGVLKGLAGLERRLLSDDTGSVDFFSMSRPVDDGPVPVHQLDRVSTLIRDADRVEKEPAARRRAAVFGGIARTHMNTYAAGLRFGSRFKEIGFTHAQDSSSRALRADRIRRR